MTDHFPNEWHAHKTSVYTFIGTRRVQIATTRQPIFTPECQAANARLIAAAPELLALVEEEVEYLRSFAGGDEELTGEEIDWRNRARAAIAKARGQ